MVRARILALVALLALARAAGAAVVASVDRADVELNESFTLRVVVDTAIDTEPDVSALDEDFYVGRPSQLSNTTIVNGKISRSRTWTYVLMARRAGDLLIPPIEVGSESSNPLYVTVAPQSNELPGEADIFVTTEVDYQETYVQAQLLYTVKVYRAVATRQPRLSEPAIGGVEVIAEVLGDERTYDSILDGKGYNVVERVYALFPQESGELTIAPAHFEARVLRDGRITGRKIFESEPVRVNVKPIPAPPPEFPDAAWLPAKAVELEEHWSREPNDLPVGEPITRHITISALGQLSTQIPMLEPGESPSVKVYPDKPELRVTAEAGGILASRRDQYAMIGVMPGDVELPELRLPWFNVDLDTWQVASLPATAITMLPAGEVQPEAPQPDETPLPAADTVVVHSQLWRRVSEALAGAWALTLFGWWWSRRPKRQKREPEPPPIHKQQARILREARRAAKEGDAATVKASLLEWGRLQWPAGAARNLGDLASRVSEPLASELDRLCSATYGPGSASWDGQALAKALRSFTVLPDEADQRPAGDLPPLMP